VPEPVAGVSRIVCGIAGIFRCDRGTLDVAMVQNISGTLGHRGPDDSGWLGWTGAATVHQARYPEVLQGAWLALVHRRLAILDLSDAGWQPMATPDGRYHLVFNGEIYNYRELRLELEKLGYAFRSQSDTEVFLAAYAHWGCRALPRLVGMFAFAILDIQDRTLFLGRDFFGIKPLYYTYWQHGFAFASEITTLLELPGVRRRVNPQRLYHYLRFGLTDHGGETLFAEIAQLPAAHYLSVPLDAPQQRRPVRYWQVDMQQRCDLSFAAAAEKLRELFLDNVRLHLRSDVPVGAALSGGIDSAAIVMAMRHLQGPALPLHTFSYIADDAAVSEEAWVDLLSQTGQTVAHKVRLVPEEVVADLERLIAVQEEPFSSTSIYAQMRVFQLAREAGIKVMLDGQGADELLGGYRPYLAARLASLVRRGQWGEARRFLQCARALPGVRGSWLLCRAAGLLVPTGLQEAVRRVVGEHLVPPWLHGPWFMQHGVVPAPIWSAAGVEILREHLYQSVVENSLPMLLRYEDRNSMAFAIESRTPFLTPALAEFLFSLPEEYLIASDGTGKAVFRQAMRGMVPDPILERRDKIGFATPELCWLLALQPWADKLFRSEMAHRIPALRLAVVQREWQAVLAGQRALHSRVWRWLNLISWAQHFEVSFAA